jgi:two-component system, chemotaxis family, protein-glutamate methylesterase/glutaminase
VIGASAGGLEAIQQILSEMPRDLDAVLLVVLHTADHSGSLLPRILERACPVPVSHPRDRDRLERGRVYVAPPGFHMIVEEGSLRVLQGPRENLHRPAIDPLFRSAAAAYGRRVIGIILTGMLDDGTAGLMVVHAGGGKAIVQDPISALFPAMPRNALNQVPSAQVLPLEQIAALLTKLVGEELPDQGKPGNKPAPGAARDCALPSLIWM